MQDEYGGNLQPRGLKKYYLKSGDSMRYSWDMPAVKDKQLILSVHGRERRINVQEIGDQIPFQHRVSSCPLYKRFTLMHHHSQSVDYARLEMGVGTICQLISLPKAQPKFCDYRPTINPRAFIDLNHHLHHRLLHRQHEKGSRQLIYSIL